jgi:preprotein translocase SecE subunit
MARDRQRAKQRRRRRPASGGAANSPARTRARDTAPPPEPTEHAFPDVEEARMAEAGVPVPPPESEPEPEPDDVVEPDGAYAEDPAIVEERAEAARPPRRRGRIITFLGHVVDELRRVQWPDRRQVGQGTAVVLGFVVLAGGYLGLMDAIWRPIVEAIL